MLYTCLEQIEIHLYILPRVLIGNDRIHRVEPIGVYLYLRLKQHTNHNIIDIGRNVPGQESPGF